MDKGLPLFVILGTIIIGTIGLFSFNMKKAIKTAFPHTEKGNVHPGYTSKNYFN